MSRRAALRLMLERRSGALASWLLPPPIGAQLPSPLRSLLLGARVHRAVGRNDDAMALSDLHSLAECHSRHDLVHRLLFRRGFRPKDPASQRRLLWGVAGDPVFQESHRSYALISLSYRSLKDGDHAQAELLIPPIEAMATALENDPATLACRRNNRRNRSKLLISSYATLLHLYLLVGHRDAVAGIGERALALAARIDYEQLPADVAYRLTTNFARSLGSGYLDAWRRGDGAGQRRALAALEAVRLETLSPRHGGSGAQENHRRFVAGLLESYATGIGEPASAGPMPRPDPIEPECLLNVSTPELNQRLAEFLSA